jgi:hypothetical protein
LASASASAFFKSLFASISADPIIFSADDLRINQPIRLPIANPASTITTAIKPDISKASPPSIIVLNIS